MTDVNAAEVRRVTDLLLDALAKDAPDPYHTLTALGVVVEMIMCTAFPTTGERMAVARKFDQVLRHGILKRGRH